MDSPKVVAGNGGAAILRALSGASRVESSFRHVCVAAYTPNEPNDVPHAAIHG